MMLNGAERPVRRSALLAELGGDVLGQAADLAMGGDDLVARHAPAFHPVFDGLALGKVEPLLVDEALTVPTPGKRSAERLVIVSCRSPSVQRSAHRTDMIAEGEGLHTCRACRYRRGMLVPIGEIFGRVHVHPPSGIPAYARAARLIEEMEEQGIIGPADGARPRDVLVSSLDEVFGSSSAGGDDEDLG